jgi:adenylosuccinate synthase
MQIMDKKEMQLTMLDYLIRSKPAKWNASHTEEKNLFKRFPTHMRGTKEVKKALEELYQWEFINKYMKTGEAHVSLNIRKKKEIEEFLEN